MKNIRIAQASPVLSVLAAQGGRVIGKAAKERPKQNKRDFKGYLRRSVGRPDALARCEDNEDGLDTMA